MFKKISKLVVLVLLLMNSVLAIALDNMLFESRPVVVQNPNPRVPLAAVISFEHNIPVKTLIKISEGNRNWDINFDFDQLPSQGLPIIGLRAGRSHSFEITIEDSNGKLLKADKILNYVTPPLPPFGKEFPSIDVKISMPDLMEPGVTLMSVRRRGIGRAIWATKKQIAFTKQWGLLLALDAEGEVVWYYIAEKRIAGVDRLRNGHIYFQLTDSRTVEIDMLGNKINQWYAKDRPEGKLKGGTVVQTQTLHHQPHEMPSGNFLAFAAVAREIKNYYTTEYDEKAPKKTQQVMGDSILEFDRDGKILWKWDSFDHLDTSRIGYNLTEPYWHTRGFKNHLDWTHGNGVSYNEIDNSVIISMRNQDAIIKIDKATSEIKWIISPHSGWNKELSKKLLKPIGKNFRWPYHAHNPRLTNDGTIAVFDNAAYQSRPFNPIPWVDTTFSRGVEFKVDEKKMTVEQVWASDYERDADTCNAYAMGETQRLPTTNNMLVIFSMCPPLDKNIGFNQWDSPRYYMEYPHGGRIREYSRGKNAQLVYDVRLNDADEMMQWEIYGGLRMQNLYPSKQQREVGSKNPINKK